jgi:hypothetical protein
MPLVVFVFLLLFPIRSQFLTCFSGVHRVVAFSRPQSPVNRPGAAPLRTEIGDFLYTIGTLPFLNANGMAHGASKLCSDSPELFVYCDMLSIELVRRLDDLCAVVCFNRQIHLLTDQFPETRPHSHEQMTVTDPERDLVKILPQGDATGLFGPIACCLTGVGCPYVLCRQVCAFVGACVCLCENGNDCYCSSRVVHASRHLPCACNVSETLYISRFCILFVVVISHRLCYQFLVSKGEYGFALNNGVPEIYFPGRHVLMSPLADYIGTYKYAAVGNSQSSNTNMHVLSLSY